MLNRESSIVFIIDDSLANLQTLRQYLETVGWEVEVCEEEENAILAIQAALPDIILLDIKIPNLDGFEICRRLKTSPVTCKIPIIFISNLSDTANKIKAFNLGAVDFILKNSQPEEIVARLNLHLNISQLTQQLEKQNQQLQKITSQQKKTEEELRASEQMFAATFQEHPDPMLILSLKEGKILESNQHFQTLIGYSASEIKGKTDIELNFWGKDEQRSLIFAKVQQEELIENEVVIFQNRYRERLDILLSIRRLTFSHQAAILLLPKDITLQRETEEKLKILYQACEQSPVSIVITDSQGDIEYANPQFEEVSGYKLEEVIGKNSKLLKSDHTSPEQYRYLWETISTGKSWHGEFHNRKKNGDYYWEKASISPMFNREGMITHYVAIKEDITLQKKQGELLYRQANYDTVTGLPNRSLASDRLRQALETANRQNHKVAVMFIDLDHFKEVNDTLGHDIGDQLLRETAQRLQSGLRKVDTVARLGGDEFIIIISNTQGSDQLLIIAKRLLNLLHQPLQLGCQEVFINASIGIAIYPDDGYQETDLLRSADTAMYAAKAEGRDTFKFFTPHMNTSAQNRLQLESHLRQAINHQEIFVEYQPIIDLKTGLIIAAESLMRWHNADLGQVEPAKFIALAEDTGLIIELGEWAINQACHQMAQWRSQFPDLPPNFWMGINISKRQIRDDYFLDVITEALNQNNLNEKSVSLEITEALNLDNKPEINSVLNHLQERQITLALDDFGTGHSSLRFLHKFKFSFLKIDSSFIADLPEQPEVAILVKAIIAMAQQLDLKVIAEGVETLAQKDFLMDQGCDYAQGYFFSRSVPADLFESLLREQPFQFCSD